MEPKGKERRLKPRFNASLPCTLTLPEGDILFPDASLRCRTRDLSETGVGVVAPIYRLRLVGTRAAVRSNEASHGRVRRLVPRRNTPLDRHDDEAHTYRPRSPTRRRRPYTLRAHLAALARPNRRASGSV